MTDQEILSQLLHLEKELSNRYNKTTTECFDTKLRSEMSSILEDQNKIVFDIEDEMIKRQFITQSKSNIEDINSLKEQYAKNIESL